MVIKCVVPISGGKDSQVCLSLAVKEFGSEFVVGLFCDTGFEHPITYAHVETLKQLYGVQIIRVSSGTNVLDECVKARRFPSGTSRHCTDNLKIQPTKRWLKSTAEINIQGFEVWYGMRSGESDARAKRYTNKISSDLYQPHEIMRKYPQYLGKMGVRFRLPILDWSTEQVLTYLENKANPLYKLGFDRVGCFPCLAGGDASKWKAFDFDDFGKSQYISTVNVSGIINKPIFQSKFGARLFDERQSGCSVCSI